MEPDEYAELIERCHARGLTDGIPVIPPTAARMAQMIAASGRSRDETIGAFPSGAAVTIEAVAENALMAGCLPSYMPLVVTAFECMLAPGFPVALFYESAASYFPLIIVNGPIRPELAVNCGPNVFGPGFRANATIGRALRLGLINLAGASPGDGDRSALGSAYKFTCVVGEDEENSPWPPLHTEFGFRADESTVTVLAAWQPRQVTLLLSADPEHILRAYAEELSTVTHFWPVDVALPAASHAPKALLVLECDHRGHMRDAGWTRSRMQQFMHEVTRRRAGAVRAAGYESDPRLLRATAADEVPLYASPQDFLIISAGTAGGRSMVGGAVYAITRKVPVTSGSSPARAAADSADELIAVVDQLIDDGSSEGWPVLLPDATGVGRMIESSGREAADVVGSSPWRAAPITVSDIAVNAHMAGCSPEHMPLVVAICELLLSPETEVGLTCGAATSSHQPWVIVHGAIARELGINSGAALFGPGARANVTIGRTIRLVLVNLAGYRPNVVDRSAVGTPYRYGCVIAEDELASPWGPLHADLGFRPEQSAISLLWTAHARLIMNSEAAAPEPLLRSIAEDLSTVQNYDSTAARGSEAEAREGGQTWAQLLMNWEALVIFGPQHREILKRAGWSRRRIQEFLFEHNTRSVRDLRMKGYGESPYVPEDAHDDDRIPAHRGPDKFLIATAGGDGPATMAVRVLHRFRRAL